MPPKKNITKKSTTQKQSQKKAKQQQQQQQGQNVKINIRVGEVKKPRAPRKPSDKKQPPKPPPRPPPNVPIQQPQYVPMFLSQQPAQYFTPPVPATTLPVAPPGTAIAPITATPTAPIATPTLTAPITTPTLTAPIITPTLPVPTIRSLPPPRPRPRPTSPGRMSPIPTAPTITRATTAPSIKLNTFTNFTPRQDIISNFIAFGDLDEPRAFSFNDYAGVFTNVDDWVQGYVNEFNDFNDTRSTESEEISISGFIRDFGTQTQDILPSAMSATLREMETQTEQFIFPPPPPRQTQQQRQALPPPILKEFIAPSQDIQPSAVQSIVNLTQENLAKFGGLSSNKEYAPSEISDITEQYSLSGRSNITQSTLQSSIIEQARKREGQRQQTLDEIMKKREEKRKEESGGIIGEIQRKAREQQERDKTPIEEILKQQKEEKKKEERDKGIVGQMTREIEKRRQFLQPDEEDEEIDLSEWEVEKPKSPPSIEKPDKKKMTRKPGSGRPKGSGNKSDAEKEYDKIVETQKKLIRENKMKIRNMKERRIDTDEKDNTIADYEKVIEEAQQLIERTNVLIQEERDARRLQPIQEFGFEEEEEEY